MDKKFRIGIVGATGYVGMELVRVLCNHSDFVITRLVSQSYVGKNFSDVYPAFRNLVDMKCTDLDIQDLGANCDIVITALPHGVSSVVVPKLLDKGLRVLDHSGDFRYKDIAVYEKAYKLVHPIPELAGKAVYGLPEIYRNDIKYAKLVANPGCYPTCSILAIKPLLSNNVIETNSIIVDATSGVSGAGRSADIAFSFCETESAFRAYSPVGHRHTSEIEQICSEISKDDIKLSFTPHLAPMKRGMHATIYATLKSPLSQDEIRNMFLDEYADEFFIRVLPIGICPDTRNVAYTNFADISVFVDEHTGRVIVLCAIDNLGKGAALQAVQALNCMTGISEKSGLTQTGGGI